MEAGEPEQKQHTHDLNLFVKEKSERISNSKRDKEDEINKILAKRAQDLEMLERNLNLMSPGQDLDKSLIKGQIDLIKDNIEKWEWGSENVKRNEVYYHGEMKEMQDRFVRDTEKLTETVDNSIKNMRLVSKLKKPHPPDN